MSEVRRAGDRFTTTTPGITTRHSFSFGAHYDPADIAHGLLVAHNDDRLEPGSGYPTHPHRDLEIVTWVLSGALRHEDSAGRSGVVEAGSVQVMSAGTGVQHAEWNDAGAARAVRFVQMWVRPDEPGGAPTYSQAPAPDGELVVLASGLDRHRSGAALRLGVSAALHLGRLPVGRSVGLPDAAYLHLFVTSGEVVLEGTGPLLEGDAARLTGAGGVRVSATTDAEVLAWEMQPGRASGGRR